VADQQADIERAIAQVEVLLDRYGIVTRNSVRAEKIPGGFAAVYRVLATAEEQGKVRRGYFIDRLGGSQFASTRAINQLRRLARTDLPETADAPSVMVASDQTDLTGHESSARSDRPDAVATPNRPDAVSSQNRPTSGVTPPATSSPVDSWDDDITHPGSPAAFVLAAADPANPYGATLDWPVAPSWQQPEIDPAAPERRGHQPARKAGALVVLLAGELTAFIERGGRTVLTWTDDPAELAETARALADTVHRGQLDRITIATIDGHSVVTREARQYCPLVPALEQAGFVLGPQGLRLRR
jgi:ATP-dependent Lhr-like helicase